jgi:hypothetical protein
VDKEQTKSEAADVSMLKSVQQTRTEPRRPINDGDGCQESEQYACSTEISERQMVDKYACLSAYQTDCMHAGGKQQVRVWTKEGYMLEWVVFREARTG